MKTSEVLRKAGDVLRERGWCQGQLENDGGNVCAFVALQVGEHGATVDHGGYFSSAPIYKLVECVVGTRDLGQWNDDPDRRISDIAQALDAAYVVALQEEGVEPGDVL